MDLTPRDNVLFAAAGLGFLAVFGVAMFCLIYLFHRGYVAYKSRDRQPPY